MFCARPADYEPTGSAAVGRLHEAVIAKGAESGFYVSARDFTKEARDYEKSAPVKLVDEQQLKKSMDRSMRGLRLPVTYDAMCCQCGDVVTHRLDKAKAIPCVMGHPVRANDRDGRSPAERIPDPEDEAPPGHEPEDADEAHDPGNAGALIATQQQLWAQAKAGAVKTSPDGLAGICMPRVPGPPAMGKTQRRTSHLTAQAPPEAFEKTEEQLGNRPP